MYSRVLIFKEPAKKDLPKLSLLSIILNFFTFPFNRKNQLKRVCQVPAEGLSSDVWAWRKYGQKPIKGSPYPR